MNALDTVVTNAECLTTEEVINVLQIVEMNISDLKVKLQDLHDQQGVLEEDYNNVMNLIHHSKANAPLNVVLK
ncbi:hypothetical protein PCE1_002734 [Barthelona sp. PCE]